ncbi:MULTISPECIES: archaeosortase/exosortase family protein [Aphanothece]|uniref:archaeosortase/exosortase family protein n=1 Tax=Aphanothece TaxID=1121 RepID=UPI003984B001
MAFTPQPPRGPALARLTLLAALAGAQLTLAQRAGVGDFVVMAALSWLAGGLLLLEREEQGQVPPLAAIPWSRFSAGVLLLLWALLALSFAARLYDPLLWGLPLASLAGLALLAGVPCRAALFGKLLLIGALLPLQGIVNALWPVEPLALITARFTAFLLWLVGRPAFADGRQVMLDNQILVVDGGCTGHTTLSFCLATLVVLVVLFPLGNLGLPPGRLTGRWSRLGLAALAVALLLLGVMLINAVRIALLAYTLKDPGLQGWRAWQSFDFWHSGAGAQLFALLASGLVCGAYVLLLEWNLRRRRRRRTGSGGSAP